MKKVLFVCHGNICRSPMAEFIMKELVREHNPSQDFYIESAAVSSEEAGSDMYPAAKKVLKEHQIPFSKHKARKVRIDDGEAFDAIYVMDTSNLNRIHHCFAEAKRKFNCCCLINPSAIPGIPMTLKQLMSRFLRDALCVWMS